MAWQWIGFGRRQELPESLSWEVYCSPLLTLWQREEREWNRESGGSMPCVGLLPSAGRQVSEQSVCEAGETSATLLCVPVESIVWLL